MSAPAKTTTPEPPADARAARLWTPERVPLTVPLAGLGERALAYGVDLGLIVAFVIAGLFLYNVRGDLEADLGALTPLGRLALVLVTIAVVVGYDFLFEVFGDGRTPGKRLMKLRVVTARGRTPDGVTSLLRNLMRLIDALPFFYGVGTIALFVTGTRRLGDLVADTFVVTERARALDPFAPCLEAAGGRGPLEAKRDLSDQALLVALELIAHTRELPKDVADKLLRKRLARLYPPLLEDVSDEDARVRLARACLAAREARGGVGAQIARALSAERALADALDRARHKPSFEDIDALDHALRHAASELMRATRRGAPARVLEALSLTLLDAERHRAKRGTRLSLLKLLAVEVPGAVYQERRQIGRAALVFSLSCLTGFALSYADSALAKALVGDELAAAIEHGANWTDRIEDEGAYASAAVTIILNNTRIAAIAFVLGLFGGIGSLLVLFGNGLHLGSVFGYAVKLGTAGTLGKFILAHGPTELTAICVAGAAGLCLGRAIVAPGRRGRLEALREEASRGGKLLFAALSMLLVIGSVEGFVSPGSYFPWAVNAAVGVALISLFVTWTVLLGRPAAARAAA